MFGLMAAPAPAARLARADGLTYDPDVACSHLIQADPRLGALMSRAGPFTLRPRPAQSLFSALMRSIVYQQLTGKAAETILGRAIRACGTRPIPHSATGPGNFPRASTRGGPLHRQDRCGTRSRHQDPGRDGPFSRPYPPDGRRGDHSAPYSGSWYRPLDGGDAANVPLGPPGRVPGNRPRSTQGLWTGVCPRQAAGPGNHAATGRAMAALPQRRQLVSMAGTGIVS